MFRMGGRLDEAQQRDIPLGVRVNDGDALFAMAPVAVDPQRFTVVGLLCAVSGREQVEGIDKKCAADEAPSAPRLARQQPGQCLFDLRVRHRAISSRWRSP